MKSSSLSGLRSRPWLLAAAVTVVFPMVAAAADGTWITDGDGLWSNSANWQAGTIADGVGSTANLTLNISAARTLTIDGTARTLGTLNIGDTTTPFFSMTLGASGGATLTLNNGGSGAQINQVSTSNGDTISVPLVLADNLQVTNAAAAKTLTLSGAISGSGNFTKMGTGQVTLGSGNSYVGTTTVLSGTLQANSATSFGSSTSAIVLGDTSGNSNSGLALGPGTVSMNRAITVQAGNTGTATLTLGGSISSPSSFTGAITLGAGTAGHNLTLGASTSSNGGGWTGAIFDPAGLTGTAGVVTINENYNINTFGNAASSYTGGTVINNLNTGNNNTFMNLNTGQIFGTGNVTINSLITRQSNSSNHITGSNAQTWNGDWSVNGGSGGTLFWDMTGNINLGSLTASQTGVANPTSATRTLYVGGVTSIGGRLTDGSNGITRNFALGATDPSGGNTGSTLTLTGASTYTGTTSIRNGTLSISAIGDVGSGPSNIGAPTTVADGTISIGSTTFTGALLYTGPAKSSDRVINLAGTTGGATLTGSGTGALTLTSNFTATGVGNKTLTLNGTTAGNAISGAIVDNGGGNKTSVSKSGTGSWILSGANTYTGSTTLTAGTLSLASTTSRNTIATSSQILVGDTLANSGAGLNVTGIITAGGGFQVAPGQTLGGFGTVTGDASTASGSFLSPGGLGANALGTTTFAGSLNIGVGTSLLFDLNAVGASDQLKTSSLLLNGLDFSSFAFTTAGSFGAGTYRLIDSSGPISGALGSALTSSQFAGYTATLSLDALNNDLNLTVIAVPEPSVWAMAVAGAAMVTVSGARRRRRS